MSRIAPSTGRAERARVIVACTVLLTATLVFANSLSNGFALDDHKIIEGNPALRSLRNLPELVTSDYWQPSVRSGLYRPVATLSYALDHAVGGVDPVGFHAVNVMLHALAATLVFWTLLALTGDGLVAGGAALLFAVHAVHSEVVASVAGGRPDLLAAVFLLLSWWLHLTRADPTGRSPPGPGYVASLLCYAVATLSKESALAFPAALVAGDLLFRTDRDLPLRERIQALLARNLGRYLGFAAVAAASLVVRALVLGSLVSQADLSDPVSNPLIELDAGGRVLNALWVTVLYLRLLVAPVHLSYDYSHAQIPLIDSLSDPRAGLALATLALAVLVSVATLRRAPAACFGLVFFAATFALVSNVPVPIGTILAERLLYTPSIGFCLVVAAAAGAAARRLSAARPLGIFALLMSLVLVPHAVRSMARNRDWKDSSTLYVADLESAPLSTKVQANAGWVLLLGGDAAGSLARFERAVELGKGPEWFLDPYRGRTYALWELGRKAEAREAYRSFVRHGGVDPRLDQVVGCDAGSPPCPNSL